MALKRAKKPPILRVDLTFDKWLLWNVPANTLFLFLQTLGIVFVLLNFLDANEPNYRSAAPLLVFDIILVGFGGGTALGAIQAMTLSPTLDLWRWIVACIIGATIGWTLFAVGLFGVLNSTSLSLFSPPVIILAATFSVILSSSQAAILRKYVQGAGWWAAIYALLWTIPLCFVLSYLFPLDNILAAGVTILALALLQAVVGYIALYLLTARTQATAE